MSTVSDAIRAELIEKIELSRQYNTKIQEAKTSTKKKYYLQKLKANNNLVSEMLLTLDKIGKGKKE